jgi:hypothetical protein
VDKSELGRDIAASRQWHKSFTEATRRLVLLAAKSNVDPQHIPEIILGGASLVIAEFSQKIVDLSRTNRNMPVHWNVQPATQPHRECIVAVAGSLNAVYGVVNRSEHSALRRPKQGLAKRLKST